MKATPSFIGKMLLNGEIGFLFLSVIAIVISFNFPWVLPGANPKDFLTMVGIYLSIGYMLIGIMMFPFYIKAVVYLKWSRLRNIIVFLFVLLFLPILIAAQADYARRAIKVMVKDNGKASPK